MDKSQCGWLDWIEGTKSDPGCFASSGLLVRDLNKTCDLILAWVVLCGVWGWGAGGAFRSMWQEKKPSTDLWVNCAGIRGNRSRYTSRLQTSSLYLTKSKVYQYVIQIPASKPSQIRKQNDRTNWLTQLYICLDTPRYRTDMKLILNPLISIFLENEKRYVVSWFLRFLSVKTRVPLSTVYMVYILCQIKYKSKNVIFRWIIFSNTGWMSLLTCNRVWPKIWTSGNQLGFVI